MKAKKLWVVLGCVAFHLALAGCGIPVESSGVIVDRSKETERFSSVAISGFQDVSIVHGKTFSVSVSADKNLMPHVHVGLENGKLSLTRGFVHLIGKVAFKATITTPEMVDVDLSGGATATLTNFRREGDFSIRLSGAAKLAFEKLEVAGKLDVRLSGASVLTLDAKAKSLDLHLSGASILRGALYVDDAKFRFSGASRVELKGLAKHSELRASGASDLFMKDFCATDAQLHLSGASKLSLNVHSALSAQLSGASILKLYGKASLGNIDTSGASIIQRKSQ